MRTLHTALFTALIALNWPLFAFAESSSPCPSDSKFGCFEVGLPGNEKLAAGSPIERFLDSPKPIVDFINVAVNVVIAVLVIIGVISITIGGYLYMTAGGDAGQVKTAKEMILAAIVGIFLSLISVVILNTINKYLGSAAQEPQLGGISPAPGTGANAVGDGLSSSQRQERDNSLPKAGDNSARPVPFNNLLPNNNQEAIDITSSDINALVQNTATIPMNTTVSEDTMRGLRRNEIIAKLKIKELEISSRLLTTEQYLTVLDIKQQLQGVSNHLKTLRVTQ